MSSNERRKAVMPPTVPSSGSLHKYHRTFQQKSQGMSTQRSTTREQQRSRIALGQLRSSSFRRHLSRKRSHARVPSTQSILVTQRIQRSTESNFQAAAPKNANFRPRVELPKELEVIDLTSENEVVMIEEEDPITTFHAFHSPPPRNSNNLVLNWLMSIGEQPPCEEQTPRISDPSSRCSPQVTQMNAEFGSQKDLSQNIPTQSPSSQTVASQAPFATVTSVRTVEQTEQSSVNPTTSARTLRYLFRAYTSTSAGINRADGFRAGQFLNPRLPVDKAPSLDEPWFQRELSNHFNRYNASTSVISVTHSLIWLISIALNSKNNDTKVTVLDSSSILSYTSIYSGKDVFQLLKSLQVVNAEHLRYRATTEWLVWGEIRQESILHTISLTAIENLVSTNRDAAEILRLDDLKGKSLGSARIKFIDENLSLSHGSFVGFARILLLFGVTPRSESDLVEAFVYGLVQGWALSVTNEVLDEGFSLWLHQYFRHGGATMSEHEQQIRFPLLIKAFRDGARNGMRDIRSYTPSKLTL